MAAAEVVTTGPAAGARELTSRQLLIWAEQELAPDVPSNNMLMCFSIEGAVDPDRFERAFERVVNEYDALRTVILDVDGSPRQLVRPEAPRPFEFLDLSGDGDSEEVFRAWRDARCVKRFRLDEQLFDCVLVRLSDRRSVWYLCQHHVICDAWSFSLVFKRTSDLYGDAEAPEEEREEEEGRRIRSFGQYLDSEREYQDSDRHAAAREFWKARFASPIEPLHPYGANPRGKRPATHRLSVELGDARSRKVRELAQREEMRAATETLSLSMIFTTALYAFLHRISGNEIVGIGCPVQNRPSRWSKQTVGLFMEVCPFQVQISEDDTFASLHEKAVRENFEVLPQSRCSVSNPIRNKRYDAMLNFHNASIPDFAGQHTQADIRTGLVALASQPDTQGGSTSWDAGDLLTLQILDFDDTGRFQLHFEFNVDVFEDAVRQPAVEHFINLLDAMLADPNQRVSAAPMLTAGEREAILSELEEAASEPPDGRHVLDRFRDWVSRDPGRTALIQGNPSHPAGDLSYGELDDRIRSLAASIREAGVGYEDRVAICLSRSPDLLVALLATHDASAAYVPIDPDQPADRIQLILEDADPALIITEASLAERVVGCETPKICLEPRWWEADAAPDSAATSPGQDHGGRLAYVIFTSGSTGRPKGVEIEHRSLSNFMTAMAHAPGLSESDRLLAITTASFDISALELFLPLTVGACVEIADEETCRDPGTLAERLEASQITVMQATPATWQMLVDAGWSNRSGLRILCGGDALSRELADALLERSDEVWNLYGPTETTIWSTVERIGPGTGPVSIGRPIDCTSLRIMTSGLEPVPRGVPGELFIGGAGLARGYCGRPDLTGERFVVTRNRAEGLLYRTGDRVRQLPDGRLECLGRVDFQVKIRGFRIELGEIEAALRQADDVAEAVVMADGDGARDRQLVAYLVPRKEADLDVEALSTSLRTSLPSYMIPSRWLLLEQLPLTQNGKIDRGALHAALGEERRVARGSEPPRDDTEVQIAAIWRDLLGVLEIGRDDDFFDLGGNSLLAVEGLRRLDAELGEHVPLGTFFERPTLAGVRAALHSGGESPAATVIALRPGSGSRPLFCIGGIHLYQSLANELDASHPVFGVFLHKDGERIAALRRGERPELPSTESMASEYIEIIRSIQPQGPYGLIGLSYGGILAYEIAQQLTQAGESIDGLILLDVRLQTAIARAGGPGRYLRHQARAATGWLSRVVALRDPTQSPAEMHDLMFVEALLRYERRIEPYSGSALLCRALGQAPETLAWAPTLGWSDLVQGELTLADCPGDHLGLITGENVQTTARAIETYLEGATS